MSGCSYFKILSQGIIKALDLFLGVLLVNLYLEFSHSGKCQCLGIETRCSFVWGAAGIEEGTGGRSPPLEMYIGDLTQRKHFCTFVSDFSKMFTQDEVANLRTFKR